MVGHLLLCILLFQTIDAAVVPPAPRKWLTLSGGQPEIIAHGGYSGFYPDSTEIAYGHALATSLPGTVLYCNLHFSQDGDGFCTSQINLQNTTLIEKIDPNKAKTYNINGHEVTGYFGVDYPANFLFTKVGVRQSNYKRAPVYDNTSLIMGPYTLIEKQEGPPVRLWLNVENDLFYQQFNISAEAYILELPVKPEFISSPEIGFLKSIGEKLDRSKTKLIFTVTDGEEVEPTTKTPYGALIQDDLAMIKSFASGILVPKEYIWDVDQNMFLFPAASNLVPDAHKVGLAVFASGFANDNYISYNYSYDPTLEYLQFADNSRFSVDGFLTEFPSTASESLTCINTDKNAPRLLNPLIITHNGACGDYPDSTDLAYIKAIEDGADIIDCNVQISKDGVAFCSDRADLMRTSTVGQLFRDRLTNVTEVQSYHGVFCFDLTWAEILTIKPQIKAPFGDLFPARNPLNKHSGRFVTVVAFLELAKTKGARGVLFNIQNAAYLKARRNLDVIGAVRSALSQPGALDKKQRVMIQSDKMSVLRDFEGSGYERVFFMQNTTMKPGEVIGKADSVFVHRRSLVVTTDSFVINTTNIIPALHAAKIPLYVGILRNEFLNLAQNYQSDPYAELSTLFKQQVDGFVTEFPLTASTFVRSSCTAEGSPYIIAPLVPGVNI